jgi:hypothetical protein
MVIDWALLKKQIKLFLVIQFLIMPCILKLKEMVNLNLKSYTLIADLNKNLII